MTSALPNDQAWLNLVPMLFYNLFYRELVILFSKEKKKVS